MTNTAPQPPPNTSATPQLPRPSVGFDWQDWLPHLADADIPDDQKREFIETLWSIVLGFVDLGFEIKTPAETCGVSIDLKAALEAAVLYSEDARSDTPPAMPQQIDQSGEDAR